MEKGVVNTASGSSVIPGGEYTSTYTGDEGSERPAYTFIGR